MQKHEKIWVLFHWLKLNLKIGKKSQEYKEYLYLQLSRTIMKKTGGERDRPHVKYFIDQIDKLVDIKNTSVLCIGCRDRFELDSFHRIGVQKVIGIDLQSNIEDIIIMDMHDMKFPDNEFDIVFSSHSLEHSYNPKRVADEIARVLRPGGIIAIETPIKYEVRGSDLVDFGSVHGIHQLFPGISHVYHAIEESPNTENNPHGTYIARTIFSM